MRPLAIFGLALTLHAAPQTIKVRIDAATSALPLERYVAAVLAGESSSFHSDEALRAMAVAARTFAIHFRGRHSAEGYDVCSTTHCQHLETSAVNAHLTAIAEATAGELLWFEGKPAIAYYSQDCGGMTEDSDAVWPGTAAGYLIHHPDPYCVRAGSIPWEWRISPELVLGVLGRAQLRGPAVLERVAISQKTPSGRARELTLSGGGESVRISASSFRFAIARALGLNTVRSDRYVITGKGLVLQGSGGGHGVGLCQRGADQMGTEGRSYRDILSFYFPGTVVGLTARGFAWTRITGEAAALMTTRPEQDRTILAAAERQARNAGVSGIEIRVYPDLDTFRDATGEPGWVAAYTTGKRIHLQPSVDRVSLDATLRHETLHIMVEEKARAGLPLWFREGLVGWLSGEARNAAGSSAPPPPTDAELRQRTDAARARKSYNVASAAVSALVARYGEATVMGWLATGLPREVKNASTSPAPTKSK